MTLDLSIRGAKVVDGLGALRFRADVGVAGGRTVEKGWAASLVLFDETRIKPRLSTVETDLPGGARRLAQRAGGIAATVVNGVVTLANGESTGETPGALLKGPWL